ncbi:4Fe-4S ferredoxin iron-sulfur binding domain protein [Kribbella flavida DSM 17836]|uniref:ferredoxin--NADP(+) reductase n=1 Tax=Kribbella flavida (strain DSM 17836 / JCM 10339 / NBRC 14399) TaxID=479435 RepID=D2Q4V0_KRIFD|nr:FAD-dependent oxidoreductase [Kribbella flavida]ADB34205.1 4Fe-4S ferredoxin iron-sulfur binding domain protein [Kribbella flavida DSM 17836]
MTYVIAGDCCADARCVSACPMNCIHPSPGEPGFGTTDGLFIDPRTCIDCGACAEVCPVDAAQPADKAAPIDVALNAAYFAERPAVDALDLDAWEPPRFDRWTGGPRRVAVVGAGPAGMYATRELLQRSTAEVTLIDRLPVVGGLARFGVAPDHPLTKQILGTFERIAAHPRVRWQPGTEAVAAELERRYDAVVHAVGAFRSRRLGIPGEHGERSCPAAEVVAWYNGRPGAQQVPVELTGRRAVIVGTGNVALDLARLLISTPERLAGLDLPAAVRETLRASEITEVVILGRRGPESAAYTGSAFRDLRALDGVEVVLDDTDVPAELSRQEDADGAWGTTRTPAGAPARSTDRRPHPRQAAQGADAQCTERLELLRGVRREPVDLANEPRPGRRVVLRFGATPTRWDPAAGLSTAAGDLIRAGNLFTAIGFVGQPVDGLPFDGVLGIVPNVRGAVIGRPGHFVTGWIKRGARGGIGVNRACAEETVRTLLTGAEVSPALL